MVTASSSALLSGAAELSTRLALSRKRSRGITYHIDLMMQEYDWIVHLKHLWLLRGGGKVPG